MPLTVTKVMRRVRYSLEQAKKDKVLSLVGGEMPTGKDASNYRAINGTVYRSPELFGSGWEFEDKDTLLKMIPVLIACSEADQAGGAPSFPDQVTREEADETITELFDHLNNFERAQFFADHANGAYLTLAAKAKPKSGTTLESLKQAFLQMMGKPGAPMNLWPEYAQADAAGKLKDFLTRVLSAS